MTAGAPPVGRRAAGSATARAVVESPARLVVWAVLLVVTGALGYLTLFTTFAPTDDEGFFLATIKGFVAGTPLFDTTHGPYGPFYYELMVAGYKGLGLGVTNDGARILTLLFWIVGSFLLALAVRRLTGSAVLAAIVYVVAFWNLDSVPNEPGHPSHLLMALLGAAVAVAAIQVERHPRAALAALGALTAASILSKVNIGGFAIAALGFACIVASPALRARRLLAFGVSALFVLVPLGVVASVMSQSGFVVYGCHVALGALAVAVIALGWTPAEEDGRSAGWLVWAAAGAVVLTVVVSAIVLLDGTSLHALIRGTFLDALVFEGSGVGNIGSPLGLPANAIPYDAAAVAVAAAVVLRVFPSGTAWRRAGAVGRIAAGLWTIWALLGANPLGTPVALVFVAAIPVAGEARTPARRFARIFIPALTVLQVLHSFPVAGSQIRFAAFLLVATAGISIGDGLRELGLSVPALDVRRLTAVLGLGLGLWLGITTLLLPLHDRVQSYRRGTPIHAYGATAIRLPADVAAQYTGAVAAIRKDCRTFITSPGLGSLYVMAQQSPPSWKDIAPGLGGWDDAIQRELVAQARATPGLCAVRYPALENWWARNQPIPSWPLRDYIVNDFTQTLAVSQFIAVLGRPA